MECPLLIACAIRKKVHRVNILAISVMGEGKVCLKQRRTVSHDKSIYFLLFNAIIKLFQVLQFCIIVSIAVFLFLVQCMFCISSVFACQRNEEKIAGWGEIVIFGQNIYPWSVQNFDSYIPSCFTIKDSHHEQTTEKGKGKAVHINKYMRWLKRAMFV